MKKSLTRFAAIPLTLAIAFSTSGCRIGNTEILFRSEDTAPGVLFTLNGEECKLAEAKLYLCNYKSLYGNIFDLDLWNGSFDEDQLEEYVKDVSLEEIELIYCISGLAKEQGVELTEQEKSQISDCAEAYFDSLTEDEVTFMEITEGEVEDAYQRYALAQKIYTNLTDGAEEEVSDDEARVIQLNQIYVEDSDIADTVAKKLADGEDFSAVAATYNEATSIEIYVSRGQLSQAAEDIAFNLDDGEISEEIQGDDGYYFFQCVSKFVEDKTQENKEVIRIQKQKAEFDSLFDEYASDATFHFNQDVWDEISVKNEDYLTTDSFFSLYDEYL